MSDLISRQAAIDALGVEPLAYTDYEEGLHTKWADAKEALEKLPSAQPERKKGKWLHKSKQLAALNTAWWYECSICGYHAFNGMRTDFCPNCGAEMSE